MNKATLEANKAMVGAAMALVFAAKKTTNEYEAALNVVGADDGDYDVVMRNTCDTHVALTEFLKLVALKVDVGPEAASLLRTSRLRLEEAGDDGENDRILEALVEVEHALKIVLGNLVMAELELDMMELRGE